MRRLSFLFLPTLLLAFAVHGEALPVLSDDGPDAQVYGQAAGYRPASPRGNINSQPVMVGSYSHYDQVFPAVTIAAAATASPSRRAPEELGLAYSFRGRTRTLADYLAENPATGLLIARGDTILFEHYQYARTPADRFTSQSMAKTVVGLLVGTAVADGSIRSVDDPAEAYVPDWTGTELGRTPIRALLRMSSGLAFTETYDGTDDNAALGRGLFARTGAGPEAVVSRFGSRVAPPGTVFHYAGRDTEALGLVLAHVTGQSLATLLETRLWQPMGAEAAATWATDHTGHQIAYCCLSATLRDWARLGLLVADGGKVGGRQLVPADWIRDATAYEPGSPFAPTVDGRHWGYGYQVWLMAGDRHDVAFVGIHGQRLFVDPVSKLVLVQTAVRINPTGNPGNVELAALWRALVAQYGSSHLLP